MANSPMTSHRAHQQGEPIEDAEDLSMIQRAHQQYGGLNNHMAGPTTMQRPINDVEGPLTIQRTINNVEYPSTIWGAYRQCGGPVRMQGPMTVWRAHQ